MSNPPRISPKQTSGRRYTTRRLWLEIAVAAFAGIVVHVLPALFLAQRPPNYEHVVFLPIMGSAQEMPQRFHEISYGLTFVIALVLGLFGRGPVWLIGPAVEFGFPVWSLIDGLAGGGGHNLWPFEMAAYGIISLIYIVPAGIGRLANRWWMKCHPPLNA